MDISIYENGDGGEIQTSPVDVVTTNSIYNYVYLALFGGLVEEFHEDAEDTPQGEENTTYWQNALFNPEDNTEHVNGRTERFLTQLVMNSQGIQELERVVLEDLASLQDLATVTAEVELVDNDKITIEVLLQEIPNSQDISVKFVWDASREELIQEKTI